MRILAISHLFPNVGNKHFGIFAARQFLTMKQLGADVTVLVPTVWVPKVLWGLKSAWKDLDQKRQLMHYENLETIATPYLRLTRGNWSCRWEGMCVFYSIKNKIIELHKKKPFDVIYGRGFFPGADVAVRLSQILEIPAVGFGIGSDINVVPHHSSSLYKHFVWIARVLDGALGHGQGVADKISTVSGKEVPTIHGIVDLKKFAPATDKNTVRTQLNIPTDCLIALYVGGLKNTKGIYEMLEAYCRVRKIFPKMTLKICGTGQEHGKLTKLIVERNLTDSVQLVGAVEADNVAKWMQASDFLILASYSEGMPNVVMEAMACGLPIIATKVGGLPSAVGNCEGVILVEPKNVEQLEQAIFEMAKDEHQRKHKGIVAYKKALEDFGAIKNTQKVLNYLDLIISKYIAKRGILIFLNFFLF